MHRHWAAAPTSYLRESMKSWYSGHFCRMLHTIVHYSVRSTKYSEYGERRRAVHGRVASTCTPSSEVHTPDRRIIGISYETLYACIYSNVCRTPYRIVIHFNRNEMLLRRMHSGVVVLKKKHTIVLPIIYSCALLYS